MTVTSTAHIACKKPSRYLQQLVSHWSHRMPATWVNERATFPFPDGPHAEMEATDTGISIRLITADAAQDETMRGVIERHLDRFAFREAPLAYNWDAPVAA